MPVALMAETGTEVAFSAVPGIADRVFDAPLIVLFVSVSVVARPTSVSVDVGSVSVPVFVIELMVGLVSVRPAIVVAVAPRLTGVDPIVTALFVSDELPMPEIVFDAPEIVLFVSVCVPSTVTAALAPIVRLPVTVVLPEAST